MQIVGVDFGTTNVRIAVWDTDKPNNVPQVVEFDGATTMPAVIAFQRQPGGEVDTVVGSDADGLEDGDNTVVVRNIKRWAVSHDPYVEWSLDSKEIRWESWWDPHRRSVNVWGHEFPVKELMKRILEEAFRQAGLNGQSFEWRAGCPVHADLDYRTELAQVVSELSGSQANLRWVIEEPILFLVMALNLGTLDPGSYMVYDVGGGSFDCALAEVQDDRQMVVYASDGDPLLGGTNIDDLLKEKLGFGGRLSLLRVAKEQLTETAPTVPVDADTNLLLSDIEDVVAKSRFLEDSLLPMRLAYITAKIIWKTDGSPIAMDVPSCRLRMLPEALRRDLDGIILFGGPTRSPVFSQWLREKFGPDKVMLPEDLTRGQIRDPHLTALSAGACYVSAGDYNPLYTSRLPIRVTLRNRMTGESVEYRPYQHFTSDPQEYSTSYFNPIKPFVSRPLCPQPGTNGDYLLTVEDVDGDTPISQSIELKSQSLVGLDRPRFVIDTLGRIWVGNPWIMLFDEMNHNNRLRVGQDGSRILKDTLGRIWVENPGKPWSVVEKTPWQTGRQREVMQAILEEQRQYEEMERGRIHGLLTENPFGWQSGHG